MQSYFMRDIGSRPTGQTRNDKKLRNIGIGSIRTNTGYKWVSCPTTIFLTEAAAAAVSDMMERNWKIIEQTR